MGRSRHALLVGVPQQTEPDLPLRSIGDPVREDLRRMREALDACDYHCTVRGLGDPDESRRDAVQDAIREALRSAPADGVLLVYFSGHGLHLEGKDYVLPANAKALSDGSMDVGSLIDLDRDFFQVLDTSGCPAALVLACFDACRDGSGANAIRPYHYRAPEPTQLVVANSCSAGETSGYDADGSHFTKALAHALHPEAPHRTLRELSASVTAQLRDHDQRPRWSPAGELPDFVIAEADGVPEWVQAVSVARLWDLPCSDPQDLQDTLRASVTAAVRSLSGKYRRACEQLRHPWQDDDYPMRVLDAVAGLPAGTRPLSALEKALLCGLPFMLATALAEEFSSVFDSFTGFSRFDSAQLQNALMDHDFSPLEENRVRRLHARGENEDAWALVTWRLVHRSSGLRIAGTEGTDHLADTAERLADALLPDVASSHRKRLQAIVDQLSRYHLSYPSCTALDDYPGTSSHFKVTSQGASQLNDHDLAARWSMGAALAIDVRELSDTVGEHIGTMYPLEPEEVLLCLEDASRRVVEDRAEIQVHLCPHGAVHKALEAHATRCREAISRLHGLGLPPDLAWLRSVRAIDVSVHPAPGAYNLPLLTFQFDQRAVSHLLMGEQLYGDPALALRELYQNALDACRYRMYRYRWAESLGGGADWDGEIRITQYEREGRTVIECLDNGVGMTAEQLKDLFARAGRRLSDSSAFQHELGEWQEAGIEARFNSRFGIGVLSYFMLADEITVVTRPTNIHGQTTGEPLQAHIVGTATLFRIGPARYDNDDASKVQNGGTLIRLYLSNDQADEPTGGVSASRTLGDLLWYSEFDTRVEDESTGHHVLWRSQELRIPDGVVRSVLPVDGAPGELWWVDGDGRLLADGIATTQQTFGCVVNVRDQRDLTLSVSRNEVQSWNRNKVTALLTAHLPELASWPTVTLPWLLRFGQEAPRLGDDLLRVFSDRPLRAESLRQDDESAQEGASGQGGVFHLSDIGWCPADATLLTTGELPAVLQAFSFADELQGWRSAVLGQETRDQARRPWITTTLNMMAANQGGLYADLRAALSPRAGSRARLLAAETSAADWFLLSVRPDFGMTASYQLTARGTAVVWLPVEDTQRAVLGWRRTVLGRDYDLLVPPGLPMSTDLARILATQELRGQLLSRKQHDSWPWHVLVGVAARCRIPLGELWAELDDFPESCFGPLPALPEHLADNTPRANDAIWNNLVVSRREALQGPKALRDWAERYEGLGIPAHVRRLLGYLDVRETLTPASRSLAERLMDFHGFLEDGTVSGFDIARAAAGAQVPMGDVLEVVTQLQEPLELTGVPVISDIGVRPPEWLADLPSTQAGLELPEGSEHVRAEALHRVRRRPKEQLRKGFEVLHELGVRCPVAPAALQDLQDGDVDPDVWALVTGALHTREEDRLAYVDSWEIDAGKLLWFAAQHRLTVGEALERAARVSARWDVPLTVQPSEALARIEVTPALWTALNGAADLGSAFTETDWREVTPLSVARLAYLEDLTLYEAMSALRPFGELGVDLPELDGVTEKALGRRPTEDDLWILSRDGDGSLPAAPTDVDPLTLLRAALRLGRTPRSVHRMLAAYRPFGMTLCFTEPDDDLGVPSWEDAIILSFAGDGQAPAFEGPVGEGRIAWCARVIGRPDDTEWVRERLRLYAPMFGLEIPSAPVRTKET